MSEDALSQQVQADLDLFAYPEKDWVGATAGPDGTPVHNVVIVGGGQAGLATAFGLARERISGVVVLDENPEGLEGPWITYARMITLRTLKYLTGPDLGVPSLTFRRWFEARYGPDAWAPLVRIDKADWMRYLTWFRQTLNLPVRNNVRLSLIEPAGHLWALTVTAPTGPETILTRQVVLATGLDGGGGRRIPDFVSGLAKDVWAHTADAIDFTALAGRRVAVVGGGASAFDNAATALEHGAARVDMFIRRRAIPQINPYRALESSGFWRNFPDLDDDMRWRFIHRLMSFPMPAPVDTVQRVTRHGNAVVHYGAPVLDAAPGTRLRIPSGWHDTDFLIVGTGFTVDLRLRPEFSRVLPDIALWSDRYLPGIDRQSAEMGRHPYLGPGFELTGLPLAGLPLGPGRIRMFNGGAMVSAGPTATGLNGMPFGLPRLIGHISRDFLRDQAGSLLNRFEDYDEPDAWEAVGNERGRKP